MRPPGKQRMATPASRLGDKGFPDSGYALVVDGQSKAIFISKDQALKSIPPG